MDTARFDHLARTLAYRANRRAALTLLSRLGLAGVAAPIDALAQDAGPEGKKPNCKRRGKKRCGKICIPRGACCTRRGKKGCPCGEVRQGGTCVDCLGDACDIGEECCTGVCLGAAKCVCIAGNGPCDEDRNCCSGTCHPDTDHCACDRKGASCLAGESCCSGTCRDSRCT